MRRLCSSGTIVLLVQSEATVIIEEIKRPASGLAVFGGVYLSSLQGVKVSQKFKEMEPVAKLLQQLWQDERGQDIAEYAVMLAVILVIVVGTIRLIGSNANAVFSTVGSAIQ